MRPFLVWLPCLWIIPVCLLLSYLILQPITSRSSPVPFSFSAGSCAPGFLLLCFYDLALDNLSTRAFSVSFSPDWNLCCSLSASVLEWTLSSAAQLLSSAAVAIWAALLLPLNWFPQRFPKKRHEVFSKMSCMLRRCSPWVCKGMWEASPSDVSALSWGLQKYFLEVCRWCAEIIDCAVD